MGARLAQAVRVTPKAASKWINGEARPSHAKKVALARWLGVREAWLDYGQGRMLRDEEEREGRVSTSPC
ncbi:helix-turn-helix domain-containing protein [Salinicola tamaricis]|uniref:helix-turn-helix domain-containing protein n=1 Tax=Salinicola tamaricis TaxID=1771309 RepID=UPI000D0A01FB|nr:helix-turn-helix transcriptional regulator [Salinicola tamaricis]